MTLSYIEFLLEMPWNTKTEDNNDLKKAKEILDKNHYGLDKVKERIIEFLAVKKQTNKLSGQIICLIGPPGVGKTSLASSIASAISRNFVKISLGGVNDTAEIIGHRKTYVGAEPGRIIKEIKKAKSNNPLFLIDEIDKLSKSIQGDPASALLEVLDSEQNKHFMDIRLDLQGIDSFIPSVQNEDLLRSNSAYQSLITKTGKGNDFLGWLDLPENVDQSLVSDIQSCATKLRQLSEIVVVVGIGEGLGRRLVHPRVLCGSRGVLHGGGEHEPDESGGGLRPAGHQPRRGEGVRGWRRRTGSP
jgi:energy-coupling factor transporter ATP-binding protein EcfA2